jgi:hypothetical protein
MITFQELSARLAALEAAHHHLMTRFAIVTNWQPERCDDMPPGALQPYCTGCGTCHHSLTGCPGDSGSVGPDGFVDGGPLVFEGPVGMPGPRGPNADGSPGETKEENLQRWRDAEAHNERYFAKYPAPSA